jgi:hypothetical protein
MGEAVKLYGELGYSAALGGGVSNADFMAFAVKLRPLIMTQEVKLLTAAPWGPHL